MNEEKREIGHNFLNEQIKREKKRTKEKKKEDRKEEKRTNSKNTFCAQRRPKENVNRTHKHTSKLSG